MICTIRSDLPVILLAAGLSKRMRGRDKLLETVQDMPLLRLQATRARAATTGPVLVALPSPPHARYDVLDGCDVTSVVVTDAQDGMSASLRTALSALPQGCPAAMIALPDLPEIDAEDLAHVLASVNLAGAASIWRGATEDRLPGHPIVFRATLFEDLMRVTGDTGGAPVARAHHKDTVLVPLQGNRALNDLDTPEDWDAWRRTLPYQTNT